MNVKTQNTILLSVMMTIPCPPESPFHFCLDSLPLSAQRRSQERGDETHERPLASLHKVPKSRVPSIQLHMHHFTAPPGEEKVNSSALLSRRANGFG